MAKVSPIITNFTAGEFSPQLEGRVDISRYANAAQRLENFLVNPWGGAQRRPGTVFVAQTKNNTEKVRVIPFQFSTQQSYIIEFGAGYMRFYRDNSAVTETDSTITGASAADPVVVDDVGHGYSNGDTIIINGVVGMTELNGKRFLVANVAANTYELQDLFGTDIDGTGFTAYVSDGTSAKVFEITNTYLESELFDIQFAQTADIMYIVHNSHAPAILSRTSDTDWTLEDVVFSGGPFRTANLVAADTVNPAATTGSGITVTANTDRWLASDVGDFFAIGTGEGHGIIASFVNAQEITLDIVTDLASTGDTDNWAYGAFSERSGFPSVVAFHEQRLFYGATTLEPQTIFGSETLIFDGFTSGADDTDRLKYEIATEQVNSIRWISSGRGLGIGTSGGAFVLSSGTDFVPLTPDNVQVRRETGFGAQLIIPKRIGNFTYYVQRGGRKLREFAYNFDIDSHRALDMTLLAEHITESGLTIIDYQQSPNSILWGVRDDGEIATMTRQLDQEVIAWTRIVTGETSAGGSKYESLAIIPIPNAENDQVWVSVQRTVTRPGGSATVRRYIEFYSDEDFGEKEDAFFVDSGLTYTGVAATVLTGLDHLEGESVDILSEGSVIPAATVVNGSITLDIATTKAHIGLGYTSELQTLRIEAGSVLGTAQGKIARVYEVVIRFFESLGGELGREGLTDIIKTRDSSDPMDTSPPLFTGDKRITFPKGYDREARVFVKQEQPLPMTVLAIMPKMEVFDR